MRCLAPRTQSSSRSRDFIYSVAWLQVLTSSIVAKFNLYDNPCTKRDVSATRMCLIIKITIWIFKDSSFPPNPFPSSSPFPLSPPPPPQTLLHCYNCIWGLCTWSWMTSKTKTLRNLEITAQIEIFSFARSLVSTLLIWSRNDSELCKRAVSWEMQWEDLRRVYTPVFKPIITALLNK